MLPLTVYLLPLTDSGTWRSSVARLNGVQEVAGSNPAVPIRYVHNHHGLRRFSSGVDVPSHQSCSPIRVDIRANWITS